MSQSLRDRVPTQRWRYICSRGYMGMSSISIALDTGMTLHDAIKSRPAFPSEVFEPHDDVTPDGLAFLQYRVKPKVEGRKWTRVESKGMPLNS